MNTKYLLLLAGLLLMTGCVTRTYTTAATPPPGPTVAEIESMTQAHVSDAVIVSQIQNSSARYHLTADQIIALKNAGVGDAVLDAMINSANKAPVQTTTTVVEQGPYVYPYVAVEPWPWFWWGWGPHYYHGGGYYHGGYYRGGWHHDRR